MGSSKDCRGLPYDGSSESFEEYRKYKNQIPKDKIIEHIKGVEYGLTTLPSYDIFDGEELHAGMFWDEGFTFPYEFLHYFEKYDIGIPYEYEEYLRKIGVSE